MSKLQRGFWLALAIAIVAGVAYFAGTQQVAKAPPPPATAAKPIAHPPVGPEQREGKVQVDRAQAFTHYRVGNRNVKAIYTDGPVTWVGTSGGAIRYDTRSDEFKLYDARSGLLSNGVFYVGKLKGRIAVGTYGGGFSLFDESAQSWDTYNIPHGLGDAFVYDILEAKNGDVWIATWSGANCVRGGALDERAKWDLFTVENTRGGLPNDWVYGLAEGKDGEIWLATEGGMARYRDGRWESWNHARGLGAPYEKVKSAIEFDSDPSRVSMHHARQKEEMGLQRVDVAYNPNYVVSMKVDATGVVWAGTWGGGLARYDGKRWTNYTTAEGLPGNHVFMLHLGLDGRLWVGTNNGLASFEDGKFKLRTADDGLFGKAVFSMASGEDGTLWVGSYGGLAHLRRMRAN